MKVSVVIPFYGVEAYIGRCAESLLAQTYPDIQFIFVNDGSKDRSAEVLSEVLARYPGRDVSVLSQENAGVQHARAAGTALADGEYLLYADADDWLEKDAVSSLVACVEETGADLVYFDYWLDYPDRSRPHPNGAYAAGDRTRFVQDMFRYRTPGYLWNKFARRSLYEGMVWPDEPMNEDLVMLAQVLYRCTRIHHLERFLYHYRRNVSGSVSAQSRGVRDVQAARNFLGLYEAFHGAAPSPASCIREDILLRSAWMGWRYDRSLFADYPFLKAEAAAIPLRGNRSLKLFRQAILKAVLPFTGR